MERKHLLGTSESEDEDVSNPPRYEPPRKTHYKVGFNQLSKIINDGNLDEIRHVLKKKNIQFSDSLGQTVLHVAAVANNTDVLRLLLEHKRCSALLDSQDKEGATPLMAAATAGSYDALELLFAQGADPCKTLHKNGTNVLHIAAQKCDRKAAEIVLKYNTAPGLVNALNVNGDTPLIEAVYFKADMMDLLFQAGADITIPNPENGRTLLHVAVTQNRPEMLQEILHHPQATEDFAEVKDMKQDTALLIAVKLGKPEMITHLLNAFQNLTGVNDLDRVSVFHIAVRHDKASIVSLLINSGCNACVDYMDAHSRTPLLLAAELDRSRCLEELIEHGADYDLRNSRTGQNFTHVLAKHLCTSSLPYVMNMTDITWYFTQLDIHGNTPYMTAIKHGNAAFIRKALANMEVDLHDENAEGEPPVYYTAKHGHLKTMMSLLLSPYYYSFVKNRNNGQDVSDAETIDKLELRGEICATDVYILMGKVVKHPLVTWFPKGLLLRTHENRNVFHACALGGNIECLGFLYDFLSIFGKQYLDDMFDRPDLMGNTPLLFAAQCGVTSVSCVHFFAIRGADLASVNVSGMNVFNAIITYNPEYTEPLITSLLDSCVSGKRENYYEDRMDIKVNFTMLCPKNEDSNQMDVVYMLFNDMSNHDIPKARRNVLNHPVIELFLKCKFAAQKCYLIFRFMLYFIATTLLTVLIPIVYIGDNSEEKYSFLTPAVEKSINIFFFLASLLHPILKMPNIIKGQLWPIDILTFIPIITMAIFLCFGRKFILAPECLAITVLCCWIYVMIFITTLYHSYSFQLAMFFQILHSISKHLVVLTIILLAFSLSFFCIYHKDSKFDSFPTSFTYTFIVLLLGHFVDLPIFNKDYFTTTPVTFHFLVECFLLVAFILIIVIGFVNMLVGLAVQSANVAELEGKVYQHHHQAHIMFMLEFWLNNKFYFWLVKIGFAKKLAKVRNKQRINLEVGIYDEKIKHIVDDLNIRQFRSIVFQQNRPETSDEEVSKGSFWDPLFRWVHNKPSAPRPTTLMKKHKKWFEESATSLF